MSTTNADFIDMPLAAASSALDASSDGAIRQSRNVSPNCSISPIPRYERNMGFFHQLSRRFGLRSNDDLVFATSNEDDNQSSSTDSCSSHTPTAVMVAGDNNKKDNNLLLTSVQGSEYISCASSETSSTVDIEEQLPQQPRHQHFGDDDADNADDDAATNDNDTRCNEAVRPAYDKERKSFARSSLSRLHRRSASSLRRAFDSFSLSSRSLSCSGVTPPPNLPASASSTSTHNETPIKSALKSSSNLELNKKSQSVCLKKSPCTDSSCSAATKSTSATSKTKTKPPPQRILRQPVSYTYLKGISGLPTQRVPRSSVCCQYARR